MANHHKYILNQWKSPFCCDYILNLKTFYSNSLEAKIHISHLCQHVDVKHRNQHPHEKTLKILAF